MGQLVRRFCTCETGSALTEYGLVIAVVALGLFGVLTGFRNAVGDLTNRTSVTIARQSSQGYGSGGGVATPPVSATPVPKAPADPDSTSSDSIAVAARSPVPGPGGD
jgi:Flp pilus assembly pilin Flp